MPKREYVWPHGFAKFQNADVVLARAFADYNGDRIRSAGGMPPLMSLPAKRRMKINEELNHSKKDAKNGTTTRGPDQRTDRSSKGGEGFKMNRIYC